jgi:hypothetical protein
MNAPLNNADEPLRRLEFPPIPDPSPLPPPDAKPFEVPQAYTVDPLYSESDQPPFPAPHAYSAPTAPPTYSPSAPSAEPSGTPTSGIPTSGTPASALPASALPFASSPTSGVPGPPFPVSTIPSFATPNYAVPNTAVPGYGIPSSGIRSSAVPNAAVPSSAVPSSAVPSSGIPGSGIPGSAAPAFATAAVTASAPTAPATAPTPAPAPATAPASATAPTSPKTTASLIVPFLVACLVAAGLGVYGKLHEPTGIAVNVAGFSSPATVKVWLATVAFVLALVQLFTALVMYGKLPILNNAQWLGPVHRWSGRLAFIASIPVALHCLYALGFDDYDTRVLLHSLFGCFFYGVFAAKMLILAKKGVPNWALPLFGGLVFTALSGLFVTSALWFFTTFGVKL